MNRVFAAALATVTVLASCSPPSIPSATSSPAAASPTATSAGATTPQSTRIVNRSQEAVLVGEPIKPDELSGRIVFDDFENLYAMDVDGTNLVTIADSPAGPEFDGSWSPDGNRLAYRDSTRGINVDDEIYVARADGSSKRNITHNPANDWGPDWSPDASTIAFNSDRSGAMRGYLINPDGSNLRRIDVDAWVEYPSFSPDGTQITYMGAIGSNYEISVANLASGAARNLTEAPGEDGWPAWSPDGRTIAFSSQRDDCAYAPPADECWQTGDIGPHHDIWLVDVDGSNLRRASAEFGQFVAWSPDGQYLLVSGYALYVIRPDGTGRLELRAAGMPRALGGIPDWIDP